MQLALFVLEISPRLLRVRVSFAAGLLTSGLRPAAVPDGKDMARTPSLCCQQTGIADRWEQPDMH